MVAAFPRGLYAIVDADRLGRPGGDALREYVLAAVTGGAVVVQVRAKGQRLAPDLARRLRQAAGAVPLVINDDLALARDLAGDGLIGLHIGQDDGDVMETRRILGTRALLGLSTHALSQVLRAADLPVDYLGFGPVRATDGKQGADAPTGLPPLAAAVAATRLPVIAIGGLTGNDLPAVHASGAHGAAVIGAWLGPGGSPHAPWQAAAALAALVAAWPAG